MSHSQAEHNSLAKAVFGLVNERAVRMIAAILNVAIVARALGVAGYGTYSVVVAIGAICFPVGSLALDRVAVRQFAKSRRQVPAGRLFRGLVVLRVIGSGVGATLCGLIGVSLGWSASQTAIMCLLGLQPLAQFGDIFEFIFIAKGKTEVLAKMRLVTAILGVGVRLLAAYVHASYLVFVSVILLDSLVYSIGLTFAAKSIVQHFPRAEISARYLRRLGAISVPLTINLFFTYLYLRAVVLVTAYLLGDKAAGLVNSAVRLYEGVLPLAAAAAAAMFPELVRASERSASDFEASVVRQNAFVIIGGAMVTVVFLAVGNQVARILLGSQYSQAGVLVQIISLSAIVGFTMNIRAGYLTIVRRYTDILLISVVSAIFSICGLWILGRRFGMFGIAFAYSLGTIFNGIAVNAIMPRLRPYFLMQLKSFAYIPTSKCWRGLLAYAGRL